MPGATKMAVKELEAEGEGVHGIDQLNDFPSKESVPYLTILLSRIIMGNYFALIADTGIAPAQAFVLSELWKEEGLSQVELSRRLEIGKATVGQTLDRLERSGMIERRRLPGDRRVLSIYLTEKGRAVRKPLATAAHEQIAWLRGLAGSQNFEELTRLLTLTVERIRAAGENVPELE